MAWTKEKQRDYARKHYLKNKEEYKKRAKKWRKNNRERARVSLNIRRANNRPKHRSDNKKWRDNNPESVKLSMKKWAISNASKLKKFRILYNESHRLENKARSMLNVKIKGGHIIRPTECSVCGKRCKPHGHHHDYNKPFDVVWLCVSCHNQHHWNERTK